MIRIYDDYDRLIEDFEPAESISLDSSNIIHIIISNSIVIVVAIITMILVVIT